jgi:hypothetical protein
MNAQEAINFLKSHQSMPGGERAHNDLFSRFDEVRKYFASYPDDENIRLLIGALGPGDGHGIYPMVEDALRSHSPDAVAAALKAGLKKLSSFCPLLECSVCRWICEFRHGGRTDFSVRQW